MGDLRSLGSEKLQGTDKIRRIMEIAKYNEKPKQEINNLSTTSYTIRLADGKIYGIVKEKTGYVIKNGIHESYLDYIDQMKNRKHYKSYSNAIKRLNIIVSEVNRNEGYDFQMSLLGEQPTKKFILKPKKSNIPQSTDIGAAPDTEEVTPTSDTSLAPETPETPVTPPEDEVVNAPQEPETPVQDPTDTSLNSNTPVTQPDPEMVDMPEDDDEDEDQQIPALKSIQRLTGKLSQKIRSFDKEKGLDSQDIKYVINSIISAMDLENLDEEDKEDILSKFEDEYDYGDEGEGSLNINNDDDIDLEDENSDLEDENDYSSEKQKTPKESSQNVTDSTFYESSIENVLSKYFNISSEEKTIIDKKIKKNFINEKFNKIQQKKDIVNFSYTNAQRKSAMNIFENYENSSFIGKTNKNNLILKVNGKQIKITPNGKIL